MKDSFRVRVDKTFGSLAALPSSSLSSLWCLTDEEIERKEWNQSTDSPDDGGLEIARYPSNLDGDVVRKRGQGSSSQHPKEPSDYHKQLESDLQELEDYDDVENEIEPRGSLLQLGKPADHTDEEWDIRSSVGLDCTLDQEEEEDEYDKLAVGREHSSDLLPMWDVAEYGIDLSSHSELPNSFGHVSRDPRANHRAAKIRLMEDAEAAAKLNTLGISYEDQPSLLSDQSSKNKEICLKPILKKREKQTDDRLQKRVRFDDGCNEGGKSTGTAQDEATTSEKSLPSEEPSSLDSHESTYVPDYVRNPSKYTCYTFDPSSDIDEESNRKAHQDFLNLLRGKKTEEEQPEDLTVHLPKAVTFNPKKKMVGASNVELTHGDACLDSGHKNTLPLTAAAVDVSESEVCAMEEDLLEGQVQKSFGSQRRRDRKYRTKPTADSDDCDE